MSLKYIRIYDSDRALQLLVDNAQCILQFRRPGSLVLPISADQVRQFGLTGP